MNKFISKILVFVFIIILWSMAMGVYGQLPEAPSKENCIVSVEKDWEIATYILDTEECWKNYKEEVGWQELYKVSPLMFEKLKGISGELSSEPASSGDLASTPSGEGLPDFMKSKTIQALVSGLADVLKKIFTPIAVLFIILVGFQFVKAQGNPEELKKARENLKWVVIGTAIIVGAGILAGILEDIIREL